MKKMERNIVRPSAAALLAAAALTGAFASIASADVGLQLVIGSNDAAPGAGVDEAWRISGTGAFSQPVIDASGNVAFGATLAGTNVTSANDFGYWYGTPGSVSLITREGGPALPGVAVDATFVSRQKTQVPMSPNGQMWIGGTVGGPSVTTANDRLIWTGSFGDFGVLAREGDAAPGTVGAMISGAPDSTASSGAAMNNAGQTVAFLSLSGGDVTPGVNDAAMYLASRTGYQMIARRGDAIPGAAGDTIGSYGNSSHNGSGNVTFIANTVGVNTTQLNDNVLLQSVGGTVSMLAREGDAVPGLTDVNFAALSSPNPFFPAPPTFLNGTQVYNNGGTYLFGARLDGVGTTADDNFALMTAAGGSLDVFKRNGDAAPGIAGATLASLSINSARLNNNESIAWSATLGGSATSADDSALFFTTGGVDSLVAREGDAAPGLTDTFFGSISTFVLNNADQMIFSTTLTGADVTTANDRAIWAWDAVMGIMLVAREGQEVFGYDIGTMNFDNGANGEGGSVAFSDTGWFTFIINEGTSLGGGSAVIRTYIPAPGAAGLFALAGLAAARRRRR